MHMVSEAVVSSALCALTTAVLADIPTRIVHVGHE